jgi:hypothetical protein
MNAELNYLSKGRVRAVNVVLGPARGMSEVRRQSHNDKPVIPGKGRRHSVPGGQPYSGRESCDDEKKPYGNLGSLASDL